MNSEYGKEIPVLAKELNDLSEKATKALSDFEDELNSLMIRNPVSVSLGVGLPSLGFSRYNGNDWRITIGPYVYNEAPKEYRVLAARNKELLEKQIYLALKQALAVTKLGD